MTTHHQTDEVIATYQIFSSDEEPISAESTTTNEESISAEPTWAFTPIDPRDDATRRNLITICKPPKGIRNFKNYTHAAHVVLGTWKANFLCKYDGPAGVLHNATVIEMNESMQKATGWCSEDNEKSLTREEHVEEQRADVKDGVFKKPRSEMVGLCTIRERDDMGWHFLELRTRAVVVGGEEGGKDGDRRMVSSIAKKVVGGVQSTLLGVAELGRSSQDDGIVEGGDEGEDED